MEYFLFLLIPISSVGFMFLGDSKRERKITLNVLLISNAILYLVPVILAFSHAPKGESMWNENTGGGAYLWLYILIIPVCAISQFILIILKIVNASNTSRFDKKDKLDDVWRRKN